MSSSAAAGVPNRAEKLAFVTYLWPEYQYRHDMVWKLAFRITAVAAALMVAPFLTDESVQRVVGYWGLVALPFLALAGWWLDDLVDEARKAGSSEG